MPKRTRPIKKKRSESGHSEELQLQYGMSSMQGWRNTMEDSHSVTLSLPGALNNWAFAGVFDGHGGEKASKYASKNLLPKISERVQAANVDNLDEAEKNQRISKAIEASFFRLDRSMRRSSFVNDASGTTAICVVISPTHLYFANCGDSRALLCRDKKVYFATKDHKPTKKRERVRIERAGGYVCRRRVVGRLALSRALGDFHFKENRRIAVDAQMVIPKPDVTVIERDNMKDEFIVLACDGIFDVMTNAELNSFIVNQMALTDDLSEVCQRVIDKCFDKGSTDNMSIVLLKLPGCPPRHVWQRKRKVNFARIKDLNSAKKARYDASASNNLSGNQEDRSNNNNQNGAVQENLNGNVNQIGPLQNQGRMGEQQASSIQVRSLGPAKIGQERRPKRRSQVPNPFIMYFLDERKKNKGNICKTAKTCAQQWKNLPLRTKQVYRQKYLTAKRRAINN